MPTYLLHQTSGGIPVGVFSETHDYYDKKYEQLRPEGRQMVYSKLPSASWTDFIERLASTQPSRTMRWDTYFDASPTLAVVLSHAKRDLETTGVEVSE